MTEYPPAARQLVEQVADYFPDGKVEPAGGVDGLGVTRGMTFDETTSKWLGKILDAVDDERIANVTAHKGKVTVTFVPDVRADYADPYPIDEANEVLNG